MRIKLFASGLLVLLSFISSCSPKDEAEALARKYCKMLCNYEEMTELSQFVACEQQARDAVAPNIAEVAGKYAAYPEKLQEFNSAYVAYVAEHSSAFFDACNRATRAQLQDRVWFMENDKSNLHLYSFSDSVLNILNCKQQFAYSLSVDTLIVNDTLKALIRFEGNDALKLVSVANPEDVGCFRLATPKELVLGMWKTSRKDMTGWMEYDVKGLYHGMESKCFSGEYDIAQVDGNYRLRLDAGKGGLTGDVEFQDNDHFSVYGETHRRSKKPYLSSLNVLFNK